MWPFRVKPGRFIRTAIVENLFANCSAKDVNERFIACFFLIGCRSYRAKVLTSSRFNLMRGILQLDTMPSHLHSAVENFHELQGLEEYPTSPTDALSVERFYLLDVILHFAHALSETLASFDLMLTFSSSINDFFIEGKKSQLYRIFSKIWAVTENEEERYREIAFVLLFYSVMFRHQTEPEKKLSKFIWQFFLYLDQTDENILRNKNMCVTAKEMVLNNLIRSRKLNVLYMKKFTELVRPNTTYGLMAKQIYLFLSFAMNPDDMFVVRDLYQKHHSVKREHSMNIIHWLQERKKYDSKLAKQRWMSDEDLWESFSEEDYVPPPRSGKELPDPPSALLHYFEAWEKLAQHMEDKMLTEASYFASQVPMNDTNIDSDLRAVILAYVSTLTNRPDSVRSSVATLRKFAHRFPLANLWLAEVYVRFFEYAKALKTLESAQYQIMLYPYTTQQIDPVSEEEFNQRVEQVRQGIEAKRAGDIVCRYANCKNKDIYFASLDFNGYTELICQNKCKIKMHYDCWKLFDKDTERHGLGSECRTPDCGGEIVNAKLFNASCTVIKDYRHKKRVMKPRRNEAVTTAILLAYNKLKDDISLGRFVKMSAEFSKTDQQSLSQLLKDSTESRRYSKAESMRAVLLDSDGEERDFITEINQRLSDHCFAQKFESVEADLIEEEHRQLQEQLEALNLEYTLLREETREAKMQKEQETDSLVTEVNALTKKVAELQLLESEIPKLLEEVMQKKADVRDLDSSIMLGKSTLSGKDASLSKIRKSIQHFEDDNALEALVVLEENAQAAKKRYRDAYHELLESRFKMTIDALTATETKVAAVLRENENVNDDKALHLNYQNKRPYHQFLIDIRRKGINYGKEIQKITKEIITGARDDRRETVQEPMLPSLLEQYNQLPTLCLTVKKPSMSDVVNAVQ